MNTKIPLFNGVMLELQSNCNRDCFFCNRPADTSGKRIKADGKPVIQAMPTEHVIRLLDEIYSLGFKGVIAFHHMSEPFLDSRIIEIANEAKKRGMRPYAYTNGDVIRRNGELCREAVNVFEKIIVGIYDADTTLKIAQEEQFWTQRLRGTQVGFSRLDKLYRRTFVPNSIKVPEKRLYPNGICDLPIERLIIHYDGNVAFCCEDMKDEFNLGNVFETSIEDIWFSKTHTNIIKDLKKGLRGKYPLCSKCPVKPTHKSRFHLVWTTLKKHHIKPTVKKIFPTVLSRT